jgi:hypothetical protein
LIYSPYDFQLLRERRQAADQNHWPSVIHPFDKSCGGLFNGFDNARAKQKGEREK